MRGDFVILGATGTQGRIAAKDLLEKGFTVILCGRNKKRLDSLLSRYKKAHFRYLDLANYKSIVRAIKESKSKVVLNCAEGDWNLEALKACIEANVHSLDLGSEIPMTKQQFALHSKLNKHGLIHITGCGSVPGIGNVMLRYAMEHLDSAHDIDVGFSWNSNIKKFVLPFSIMSIVEEFTEPATNIRNGKFTKIRPMSSVEKNTDDFIGEEERFFVRHPETYTFYQFFKNKGVKNVRFYAGFPPHSFSRIDSLIELGLASKKEIMFKGMKIKPIEFVTEVLKDLPFPPGYREKEDLWVTIYGKKNGKKKKIVMKCLVPTLDGWESAGCNIDTGMTISIMAQMIHDGTISEKGSFAPEAVVPPIPFFKELAKRSMIVYENGKKVN